MCLFFGVKDIILKTDTDDLAFDVLPTSTPIKNLVELDIVMSLGLIGFRNLDLFERNVETLVNFNSLFQI